MLPLPIMPFRRMNLNEIPEFDDEYRVINTVEQGAISQHGENNKNSQLSIIQNEGYGHSPSAHIHLPRNDISQHDIFQDGSGNENTQLTVIQNVARRLNQQNNELMMAKRNPICHIPEYNF